jgi:hypothetical protein
MFGPVLSEDVASHGGCVAGCLCLGCFWLRAVSRPHDECALAAEQLGGHLDLLAATAGRSVVRAAVVAAHRLGWQPPPALASSTARPLPIDQVTTLHAACCEAVGDGQCLGGTIRPPFGRTLPMPASTKAAAGRSPSLSLLRSSLWQCQLTMCCSGRHVDMHNLSVERRSDGRCLVMATV